MNHSNINQHTNIELEFSQLQYLLSAEAVSERGKRMLQHCLAGYTHFDVNWDQLEPLADYVIGLTQQHYPEFDIPLHSRWRHFVIEGEDRAAPLFDAEHFPNALEQLLTLFDCVIVSVILDAGAGSQWRYLDKKTNQYFSRSEGLAVATLELFLSGFFSDDAKKPWQVSAKRVEKITLEEFSQAFQSTVDNPLSGIEGRLQFLKQICEVAHKSTEDAESRPANLLACLFECVGAEVCASDILHAVTLFLGEGWPSTYTVDIVDDGAKSKMRLGDTWWYQPWGNQQDMEALIPFHKLATWLALSLIEPLEACGTEVLDLHELPPLAEYRNGGLLLDGGLLQFSDPQEAAKTYQLNDEVMLEFRGLTVALLEQLAVVIRHKLNCSLEELPMACILQGGTWAAGRQLAYQQRDDGAPPIHLQSNAMVF